MRVELTISGGVAFFPGLKKPMVVTTDELAPEQSEELTRLVDAARFFELPSTVPVNKQLRDAQTTVLAIERDGRSHRVQRSDPLSEPGLAELVAFVRKQARSRPA